MPRFLHTPYLDAIKLNATSVLAYSLTCSISRPATQHSFIKFFEAIIEKFYISKILSCCTVACCMVGR